MDSYNIGISGITAAQKAFEVIGNNIANAATEGYHKQKIELTPSYSGQVGDVLFGGGVEITSVTRIIDTFLQQEIFDQNALFGQVSQELSTLQTVESTFGEFSEGSSLSTALDDFFIAMQELSAHPTESIWQNQAVTAAQTLSDQFRTLSDFLSNLENQIELEADNTVDQINILTSKVAELNESISKQEFAGGEANNLRDQRDQCIAEISELINVDVQTRDNGMIDLSVSSMPVVTGTSAIELRTGLTEDGELGIGMVNTSTYTSDIQGGKLGGLISLRNDIIPDIQNALDEMAGVIIQQINQYHVQGIGSEGSFTEITGLPVGSGTLDSLGKSIADGEIYIRVTDTSTGEVTRNLITVDVSTDSLSTIAAAISSITGLDAVVANSALHIQAESNYEFDFLPAVLSEPTASVLTGETTPSITVSGIYTGDENDTYKFTVSGAGSVGNGSLQLEVRADGGAGDVIANVNIGSGYAAGDNIDIGNGIKISVGSGDFEEGDNFEVDVFAQTDTSGFLAAVGINTFFSGSDASDIDVCSCIIDDPGRIATALGSDTMDNANVSRMVDLQDQAMTELNDQTLSECYRQLITDVGQDVSTKQMRYDNIESVIQNLKNQESDTSGVNINDEAAEMLVFEQMFKAMSKYLNIIQTSMSSLMNVI